MLKKKRKEHIGRSMISSILKLKGNKMKGKIWMKENLVAFSPSSKSFVAMTLQNTSWTKKLNTRTSAKRLQYTRSNDLFSVKKEINLLLLMLRMWTMSNQPNQRNDLQLS